VARRGAIGVVLAGGDGRRIGGDKAMVELEGRALLLYPLAVLRAVLDEVAVVAKQSTILPALDPEVAIWLEADEPRHPLAGIVHALRCARGRPVVVVAGDMPFVTRGLVGALARERSHGAVAVVPRAGGRLQPLCARYDPRALTALAACDFGAPVRDVVAALSPRIVDWPDEEPFFNVNAPEDILQAAALLSGR
jgi:molybdopterin-guanine dinucleotide biosynthesis protein A